MKVSLRKANSLQEALGEVIKSTPKTSYEVDVVYYEWWKKEINNTQSRYLDEVRGKLEMVKARFDIRKEISTHNNLCGVSDNLADLAQVDSMITTIQRWILQRPTREQDEILEKKRERKMIRLDNPEYDGYSNMDVSVISKGEHNHWTDKVQELRRKKASINDQLLELNFNTEILLSSQVEAVLRKENLI